MGFIVNKSGHDALKAKRQLLFCFHPDKNPASEAATIISQILSSVEVKGVSNNNASPPPSARRPEATPTTAPRVVSRSTTPNMRPLRTSLRAASNRRSFGSQVHS